YWLDLAGYADSEGGTSEDPIRPVAWKYCDYVVDAFNADKPYDEFLLEQIAGDELIDVDRAKVVTEEMVENLVATGFLRMGIDETGSRTMNFTENRVGVISDAINVLGSSVMGLTLDCVRCHTHKYDPIPQRDYYRLKAVFQGALDEHDWLSFKTRNVEFGTPEQRERVAAVNPPLEAELKDLEGQLKKKTVQWQREMLRSHYPGQSEEDREATFVALRRADNTRSLQQRRLVELLQTALVIPNHEQPASVQAARAVVDDLERRIGEVKRRMAPPLAIRALWDRGDPSPTYIYRRGLHTSPGRLVGPGVPSVLTDGHTPFEVIPPFPEGTPKTGRRLALAKWLTQPDHPLTSRVMVNRIWSHHFGKGLVESLENFGRQSEPPSHPELLDWLAVTFRESGWDMKAFVRMIVTSHTYRQSSQFSDRIAQVDPENRLLSHGPRFRLDAEVVRDQALFVSGLLSPTIGGKGVKPYQPENIWEPVAFGGSNTKNYIQDHGESLYRRSLYTFWKRTAPPPNMTSFDAPNRESYCLRRERSNTPLQALTLMLMNDIQFFEAARNYAQKAMMAASTTDARITALVRTATGRFPTAQEAEIIRQDFEKHLAAYTAKPEEAKKVISYGESKPDEKLASAELAAWTMVANLVLNLDEVVTKG
ncbi:MAG: DUF1553 domain-containing protein, partial [Verrucomicrobiae bacterium]|nr:DUF1553 domain-containing protein [Verrucomicrobiae bacterium]